MLGGKHNDCKVISLIILRLYIALIDQSDRFISGAIF